MRVVRWHFSAFHLIAGADRVFIELPHLSPDLRSSIKYNAQGGQVVLSFSKVKRGHQARYICHGVGRGGTERRGNVDVIVLQRDKSNLIQDVGEEVGEGRKGEREDVIRNEAPSFQTMEDRAKVSMLYVYVVFMMMCWNI